MNSFGHSFRIQIFGESHGACVGILIDGCPPGLPLDANDFAGDLDRRRSGAAGTTQRRENDTPELISGIYQGVSSGAPIHISFANRDCRSGDYTALARTPRPGHADWTAWKKYGGYADPRGGGHHSGRLTLGLVAAGVVAKKLIAPVTCHAQLLEAGGDADIAAAVRRASAAQDSIGGIVEGVATQVPAGLGEPFFDSLESQLAHLLFAIPGMRGVEFGDGFAAARLVGSLHNDAIVDRHGRTASNHAGGINGGISNGNAIVLRVAVKPTATIAQPQSTIDLDTGVPCTITACGRHDTCFAVRVPVIVEAALAIVLADAMLQNQSIARIIPKSNQGEAHDLP